jgi:hypothetical protein
MATKLGTYNKVLIALGDAVPLASLSENRLARRVLDQVWDNGVVNYCLEQGFWSFATRSTKISFSTTIIPSFGFKYAFEIPSDFCAINGVWIDEKFNCPLEIYDLEAGVLYADYDNIYLKYVSNASTYGGDLARWSDAFSDFVASRMAFEAEPLITASLNINMKLDKSQQVAKLHALNLDKRNKAKQKVPVGAWVNARFSGFNRSYDQF